MTEALTGILERYERRAREHVPEAGYDYLAAGSGDEVSLADSLAAWRGYRVRPRVLCDVSAIDVSTSVLGTSLSTPVVVAPTAYHAIVHADGELATARGVRAAGGLMVVATRATMRIEDIADALGGPWWLQVYVVRDRRLTAGIVERAVASGATALVLTGDTPYPGFKRRGNMPPVSFEQHLVNFAEHVRPGASFEEVANGMLQDDSITVDTIGWLHELSGLPVFVKGVLRGDDALRCLDAGAAGIIVSNHGGRQLDRAVSAAVALPEVVAAVAGRAPVLVDGGVRSGIDVLVALALGASAVLVGRPVLWGLAAAGDEGVRQVLECYREELQHAMGLAGLTTVAAIDRRVLHDGA